MITLSRSINNISQYGDANADQEIDRLLERVTRKYGTSNTGKKIIELLNLGHQQGLYARSQGVKPWELPKREDGMIR